MKLLSYHDPDATACTRLGALTGDHVVDLNAAVRAMLVADGCGTRAGAIADAIVPPDLVEFLDTGAYGWNVLRDALEFTDQQPTARFRKPAGGIEWLAPLPRARSLREFGQFEGHVSRYGAVTLPEVWYQYPFYWKGNPNNLLGHEAVIEWPSYTNRLDFELEIAAVVGRRGRNLAPGDAIAHLAGFTIFNDVTARDFQRLEMQYRNGFGKSKDFCNIMGPVLVTPDEIDFNRLNVTVAVNGEVWANASTANMYTPWADLVAYCSRDEWLEPGDVIASGTVDGCSGNEHLGWPSDGSILNPGDTVELTVEGIGTLRNTIGHPTNDPDPGPQAVAGGRRPNRKACGCG